MTNMSCGVPCWWVRWCTTYRSRQLTQQNHGTSLFGARSVFVFVVFLPRVLQLLTRFVFTSHALQDLGVERVIGAPLGALAQRQLDPALCPGQVVLKQADARQAEGSARVVFVQLDHATEQPLGLRDGVGVDRPVADALAVPS